MLATYHAELGLTHLLTHIDARSVSGSHVPLNSVNRRDLEPNLVDILHKDFLPIVEIGIWMVGLIFSLIITDTALTFLGITSLMGIVVNDSTLLVDEANSRLKRTQSKDKLDVEVVCVDKFGAYVTTDTAERPIEILLRDF